MSVVIAAEERWSTIEKVVIHPHRVVVSGSLGHGTVIGAVTYIVHLHLHLRDRGENG